MIDSHVEMAATRALQKLLSSRMPNLSTKAVLKKGMDVWVWYNTSAQNDPARWVEEKLIEVGDHIVTCRRSNRGSPMRVAHEDVRVTPRDKFSRDLLRDSLEDVLLKVSSSKSLGTSGIQPSEESIMVLDVFGDEDDDPIDGEIL